jgi:hypothetical protein
MNFHATLHGYLRGGAMPRIDDYKQALALAKKELSQRDPHLIADLAGALIHKDPQDHIIMIINFLNREITITWPDLELSYKDSKEELPIQSQVLLLHYLDGTRTGSKLKGEWVAFQDIPDGRFYLDAFLKRAKDPLVKKFGHKPELMVELTTEALGAEPYEYGDFSVVVKAFPNVPVALIIWEGDEEFPPEGNILFDKSISDILSAEDIAWMAGMIVYPLIGMAKGRG